MIVSSQKKQKYGQFKKLGVDFEYLLNFYKFPPLEDITIEEFETFALDRLQVLKAIEGAILRNKTEEQIRGHINQISDEFLPLRSNDGKQRYDLQAERRKDHISHFILRLAYCRNSQKKQKYGQFKKLGVDFEYLLNFYKFPPLEDITIEEFETFALDRLQVLKAIEGAILRNKTEEQIRGHINQISDEFLPLRSNDGKQRYDLQAERRKDHISHFILRLAYCRNEELRQWFLRYECILFKIRFTNEKKEDRDAFLRDENIIWPQLSSTEKESMKKELNLSQEYWKDPIFVVEFENALELVSRRAVYLKDGKAYVPAHEQITLVLSEFRKRLEEALLLASKAFPKLDDERILPLLNNINKQYLGKNFMGKNVVEGKVTADDVDELVGHFPLCMQNLHKNLRTSKHLKHYGRRQYNLFLKGIGLTIEEALIFWRKSFSMIDDSKFQREYAYNIRHNYGIEGRRKDYAPLGCMSIITNNQPGPSENHGCPFRHFSEENMKATLIDNGIRNTDQINNIITLVRDKHYQIACTKFYEITRNLEDLNEDKPVVETIQHPNQYYEASTKLTKSKKKK
ncbi:hypothetical protein Glove_341g25 [Diversispora epigaea]|uniref:DNA primase large subunit n=1 Tax=Diversispora epigaea TaxID=1348612 RepID=A0A397HGI8_9GLOM|nr:hypothetical protein Glove_341g25 [Diversispora epigaea]